MTAPGAGGPRVAVCGLGVMGSGVATRLLDSGLSVAVWNRSPARADELARLGATVHPTPRSAAAAADVVIVCLADAVALDQVLFGEGGVLSEGRHAGLLLCASTVAPDQAAQLGSAADVLDVGLLGNGKHARDGELRLYVGGDPDLLERARPVLELLSKQVLHVGPLGSGMRLKLLMNLLMGIEMQAMAEAVALGVEGGLERGVVLQAISVSGYASPVMRFKAARMADGRFDNPDFRLALMAKDLRLAVTEAASVGLALPMTDAACATHEQAVEAGLGELDCTAVVMRLAAEAVPS